MRTLLSRVSISRKISAVLVLMALVASVVGVIGFVAIDTYDDRVDDIQNRSQRALLAEQVSGLIYKTVMDSRGIYMAKNKDEVQLFGKGIRESTASIGKRMAEWESLLPPGLKADFRKLNDSANDFIAIRNELVRLGIEVAPEAAEKHGNTPEGRANRVALGKQLEATAQRNIDSIKQANDELDAFKSRMIALMLTVGIGGVGAAVAVSVVVARAGIVRPIARITDTMSHLAEGTLSVEVAGTERGDEIGGMARAVEVFRQNALDRARMAAAEEAERKSKEQRTAAVERLVAGFDSSMSGILRTVSTAAAELDATAQGMSQTAEQTNDQAASTAAAAEQASVNVQTVASATDELSASISEISAQVARSTTIAAQAVGEAQATNQRVQGLVDAAQRIGDVVKLITDIASQTNLLALNATIEAARAGEAGKGFAVVASEVKNLATQTAKATEEIAGQIASMQQATGEAANAITGIGGTIAIINEIATSIASAIEEQGAATGEIARNVQEAARGTEVVTANITEVSRGATQTGSAASQVLGAAGELSRQSEQMKIEVERFLSGIRAA
ncbi:chemotaxis protein [Azospirillum thiophilum]|uniref:Chemotaxis protein n=1 Tax=Azospirillum thiophilum TaxID=528244 RepID=A0AAC8VXT6_9PROT|nr:methyl-accepting chemotaxis protein [Azospirillum thiophilum]ALG71342.1 chemotaxis protein [Azospirillum thiophilum]KJR65004.1 chemotaxis protein [Azospirillum thiophilum]